MLTVTNILITIALWVCLCAMIAHVYKKRRLVEVSDPPWAPYGSEEKYQESINNQNRLVTIGHTFDGMFSVGQILILQMIQEIKEFRDEIGPEPRAADPKNMTLPELNKFNDTYSRPWRMKLSSGYERRFAHRIKDLMLRCEEDGITASQLRNFTNGGITSEEHTNQLLARLARLVFVIGGIEVRAEV